MIRVGPSWNKQRADKQRREKMYKYRVGLKCFGGERRERSFRRETGVVKKREIKDRKKGRWREKELDVNALFDIMVYSGGFVIPGLIQPRSFGPIPVYRKLQPHTCWLTRLTVATRAVSRQRESKRIKSSPKCLSFVLAILNERKINRVVKKLVKYYEWHE